MGSGHSLRTGLRNFSAALLRRIPFATGGIPKAVQAEIGLLENSRLFDREFYLASYQDVARAGFDPLAHYVMHGSKEGRSPNPLFDADFYAAKVSSSALKGQSQLAHYFLEGAAAGIDPHPLFDGTRYAEKYPDKASAKRNPLADFLSNGWRRNRDPHPLFSIAYYLRSNPDIAATGINPVEHYLRFGWREGRSPHPMFNSVFYLACCEQARAAGQNPLLHYILEGAAKDFDPVAYFDGNWYRAQNPDVRAAGVNPLVHFVEQGRAGRRNPNPYFDMREHFPSSGGREEPDIEAVAQKLETHLSKAPKDYRASMRRLADPLGALNAAKRRIGFFTHDLHWQGAQNSLFELAAGLRNDEFYAPVVFSFYGGPLEAEYREFGIPLIRIPRRMFYCDIGELSAVFAQNEIALLHANTSRTYEAVVAAAQAGIPSLWNIRESDDFENLFSFLDDDAKGRKVHDRAAGLASSIVFVSDKTARLWPEALREKMHVIPNGIDEARFLGCGLDLIADRDLAPRDNRIQFLSVGTFSERKNQLLLLRALELLPPQILARCSFKLIGAVDSEYSARVCKLVAELARKRSARIETVPHTATASERDSVVRAYVNADCFIQTSVNESYPRTLLEAIAANCDLIASDVFGTSEIMDADHPMLFESNNARALAERISKYASARDGGQRIAGAGAADRVINYATMKRRYLQVYRELLDEKRRDTGRF